jgi:hypothetical protein
MKHVHRSSEDVFNMVKDVIPGFKYKPRCILYVCKDQISQI